jgi:hypothetical protein
MKALQLNRKIKRRDKKTFIIRKIKAQNINFGLLDYCLSYKQQ